MDREHLEQYPKLPELTTLWTARENDTGEDEYEFVDESPIPEMKEMEEMEPQNTQENELPEPLVIQVTADEREPNDDEQSKVTDVTEVTYTIEMTGAGDKLDAFLLAIDPSLIVEVVRSGVSGIGRGDRSLKL